MTNYKHLHNEVTDYLGEFADDYDVLGIMCELMTYKHGDAVGSIDDVDPDDFTDILQRHDNAWHDPATGERISATEWYERADKYGW